MRVPLIALLLLFISFNPTPSWADYVDDCVKARGEISIRGCTRAIKSGRWKGPNLAWAYSNRGSAYDDKGQYDRAIADYGEAITLNPNDAIAYNNRGVAYRKKGQYDRAIADYEGHHAQPEICQRLRQPGQRLPEERPI